MVQILNEYAQNRVLENMKQNLTELKGETIIVRNFKALLRKQEIRGSPGIKERL